METSSPTRRLPWIVAAVLVLAGGALLLRGRLDQEATDPQPTIEDLPPSSQEAQGPGLQGSATSNEAAEANAATLPDVGHDKPGSIAGRVLEPDGTPGAGMTVRLLLGSGAEGDGSQGHATLRRSDGEGRYHFEGLRPGAYQLRVGSGMHDDEGVARDLLLGSGEALEGIDLEIPQGLRLRGRVVDVEGTPYGPTRVLFRRREGPGAEAQVWVPKEGTFEVRVREAGTYEGWASGGVLLEGAVEAGGEAARLVFDAANRKDLLVHIVDPEGEPIPRAKLRIMSGNTAGSYGGRSVLVEGGTHTLHRGRLKRFLQLTVTEPRSADGVPLPLCSETVEVAVSEATEVRIRLRPGAEVRGRVLGPADEPVAGVMVTAQPWSASASVDAGRSAQTDERGEFVVSVLPPGPTLLGIRDRTRRWRLDDSVEIVAPQADVVLRVVESTTLEVVVVDASRAPLPGVTVVAESATSSRMSVKGKTDAQGRVRLGGFDDGELIDVRAVLMIGAAEAGWTLGPVRARAPGRTELVRTGTLSLRGTVVDEEGKPLGLVAVTVGHGRAYATRGRATSEPVTGKFEFANLMPGPARVWIGYDNHNHLPTEPVDVELPAGDVQIVLRKTVGVQGRLLVPDPHAWQITWAVEMGAGGGEIDEQGRFRIPHARGPRGAILARPRDMRDARVAILEDVDPTDGPFELVERAAGTITGRISGWSSGEMRANYVTVSAERGPLRFPAEPVAEDGTFVIGGLPSGLWTLRATTPFGSTQLGGVATGSRHQMLEMPDAGPEAAAAPR